MITQVIIFPILPLTLCVDFGTSSSKASIWEKLGSSDSDRLFRLSSAVQRVLYTLIKDECLVGQAKPLSGGKSLTAFLCTLFGGPISLQGCAFKSTNGAWLTSDSEIFAEIERLHKRCARQTVFCMRYNQIESLVFFCTVSVSFWINRTDLLMSSPGLSSRWPPWMGQLWLKSTLGSDSWMRPLELTLLDLAVSLVPSLFQTSSHKHS